MPRHHTPPQKPRTPPELELKTILFPSLQRVWSVLSTLIHHLYHISITLLQDQKDTCHPQRLYIYISCFKKEETLLFIKVNGNISSEKESCGLYILWIININHITQTFPSENKYPQDSDPGSIHYYLLSGLNWLVEDMPWWQMDKWSKETWELTPRLNKRSTVVR